MNKITSTFLALALLLTGGAALAGGHLSMKDMAPPGFADDRPAVVQPEEATVMITGANRGIGYQFARIYLERGWTVIGTARKPEKATELKALGDSLPGDLVIEKLDVQDHAQIDALAAKYADTPIDILINNAAITGGAQNQMFTNLQYDVFEDVLKTNVIGPLKVTEALWESVAASDQKKIVMVSSSQGSIAQVSRPSLYFYRSSKAALNMLSVNIAGQLKKKGVSVAMVNPGPTDTDMMAGMPKKMLRTVEDATEDMVRNIDGLYLGNSGSFWQYDGTELPW